MHDIDEPRWSEALVVLSNCLRHPDPSLRRAIVSTDGANEMTAALDRVGVDSTPPSVADRDLTEDYESLFGAFRTPFAPPAASPYEEWYEGREGLMGGPPAARMLRRYEALDAELPDAYPPDHVALQLEYASILLDAGEREALREFVGDDLAWIDAFAVLVDEAVADAPFHRWCVEVLLTTVSGLRDALGVDGPTGETIERMAERGRQHAE